MKKKFSFRTSQPIWKLGRVSSVDNSDNNQVDHSRWMRFQCEHISSNFNCLTDSEGSEWASLWASLWAEPVREVSEAGHCGALSRRSVWSKGSRAEWVHEASKAGHCGVSERSRQTNIASDQLAFSKRDCLCQETCPESLLCLNQLFCLVCLLSLKTGMGNSKGDGKPLNPPRPCVDFKHKSCLVHSPGLLIHW